MHTAQALLVYLSITLSLQGIQDAIEFLWKLLKLLYVMVRCRLSFSDWLPSFRKVWSEISWSVDEGSYGSIRVMCCSDVFWFSFCLCLSVNLNDLEPTLSSVQSWQLERRTPGHPGLWVTLWGDHLVVGKQGVQIMLCPVGSWYSWKIINAIQLKQFILPVLPVPWHLILLINVISTVSFNNFR